MNLQTLRARGFDRSARLGKHRLHVGCSQCDALAINGVPCHETGCPNATHKCAGCNAEIPGRARYCEECAS